MFRNEWNWQYPMLFVKIVILIRYSNKKTIFRKMNLILDLENWHWIQKIAIFDSLQSKSLIRYKKNHLRMSIRIPKYVSYFTCLTLQIHNCHHNTVLVVPQKNRKIERAKKFYLKLWCPWVLKNPKMFFVNIDCDLAARRMAAAALCADFYCFSFFSLLYCLSSLLFFLLYIP